MFKLITMVISFISIVTAVLSPLWGWLILSVPAIALLITIVSFKLQRWEEIPELSKEANALLKKYGHFYRWTFLARDFSHCASVLDVAGIIVAVIGLFHSFWWGIAFAVINIYLMTLAARQFDPTFAMQMGLENKQTIEEVMSFVQRAKYGDSNLE